MKYLPVFLLVAFVFHFPVSTSAAQSCQYVVTAKEARLYNAPLPHVSQQVGVLPKGGVYPVLKQFSVTFSWDTPLLIQLSDDVEYWVEVGQGSLEGDCSQIGTDTTPAAKYPTVCTFTTDGNDQVSEGVYEVTSFEDGRYSLWYGHAYSQWIDAEEGTLGGACTAPPNAVALENARVWLDPDVTNASVTAVLPLNTPLTILAGPVKGSIRFDSSAEGDWYRVSDASGVIGWVWSERLQFE